MARPDGEGGQRAAPAAEASSPALEALRVTRDADVCRVAGTLDFDTAREALERVAPGIAAREVGTVDLAGVTRSNSAALALLIEWRALARRAGRDVAFVSVPDGIRQLARVCEVEELL